MICACDFQLSGNGPKLGNPLSLPGGAHETVEVVPLPTRPESRR